jgi:D-mannonate dehydratase
MKNAKNQLDLQKLAMNREIANYKRMLKEEAACGLSSCQNISLTHTESHHPVTSSAARETAFDAATATISKLRAAKDEAVVQLQEYQADAHMRAKSAEQSLGIVRDELSNKVGELAEKSNRLAGLEETCDRKGQSFRSPCRLYHRKVN